MNKQEKEIIISEKRFKEDKNFIKNLKCFHCNKRIYLNRKIEYTLIEGERIEIMFIGHKRCFPKFEELNRSEFIEVIEE